MVHVETVTRRVLALSLLVGLPLAGTEPVRAAPRVNRFREFALPADRSIPQWIAAGPDGNLWFTEYEVDQIGRITPEGIIAEFPIPGDNSYPLAITAGPDGNLWFTELSFEPHDKIGRITTDGVVTALFQLPSGSTQDWD